MDGLEFISSKEFVPNDENIGVIRISKMLVFIMMNLMKIRSGDDLTNRLI